MSAQPPSCLSHISLGTNDYPKAKAFYDAVLGTLGIRRLREEGGMACGYGRGSPDFWIGAPLDGGRAAASAGTHVCFIANSADEVKAFHAKAMELGAKDDGGPGIRPQYDPGYYAAFVLDLDGHKIEAVHMVAQGAQS